MSFYTANIALLCTTTHTLLGALADAVSRLPNCGEPGAHNVFCVNTPTGLGYASMVANYALLAFVGVWQSIRAIETPGGDDDRQWLSFWIIMFGFFM